MARVGRFGRTRRLGSSNLTQLIANLMAQQRQAEDRTAYDAWKNGGMYKGEPMTDERWLAYIKTRRDGFTRDDPLWDEWNNTLIQNRFSIGESKIGLQFKQGKVSAGAVASWYRSQLKNIPRNSEFYRDVAGRAADWAKSAAGSARASAAASARDALYKRFMGKKDAISVANATETALLQQYRKYSGSDARSLADADATMLERFFNSGFATVNGKAYSLDDWRKIAITRYNAIDSAIPLAKKLGWDTSGYKEDRATAFTSITNINTVDDRSKYETLRSSWEKDLAEAQASGDPYAIDAVNQAYLKGLRGLLKQASAGDGIKGQNADMFIGGLTAEINALTGQEVGDGKSVASQYGIAGENDALETAENTIANSNNITMLQAGTAYIGQMKPGGPMEIIVDPNRDRDKDPSLVKGLVKGPNGVSRGVHLKGEPIYSGYIVQAGATGLFGAEAQDSLKDGTGAVESTGKVVGYTFQQADGSRKYGVVDDTGNVKFSDTNPFAYLADDGKSMVAVGTPTVTMGDDGETQINDVEDGSYLTGGAGSTNLLKPVLSFGVASDAEVKAILTTSNDPGDTYKAAEWDIYLRDKKTKPVSTGPKGEAAGTPTGDSMAGGQPSIMQSTLSAALTAVREATSGLFTPQSNATASQPYTPRVGGAGTPMANAYLNPTAPRTPAPKLPGPPTAVKPPKPEEPKPPKDEKPPELAPAPKPPKASASLARGPKLL